MIRRLTVLALAFVLSSCTDDSPPPIETMDAPNGVRHTMVSDVREMSLVTAGEFSMGSNAGAADARPAGPAAPSIWCCAPGLFPEEESPHLPLR